MKSFEERLAHESLQWVADAVVSAEQRETLIARHPVRENSGHRFLAIFACVGGALLTVGVSLIIKSNWEGIGDWTKITGMVALLVATSTLGWWLKISPGNYPRTGDACLMASAVFFLLGIALISQIFHIESRPANGVLLWWLGIVVVPWLTRAKGAQFVSVSAGLIWLGMELSAKDSWFRLSSSPDAGEPEFQLIAAAVCIGVALLIYGIGLRVGSRQDFAGVHAGVGLLLVCGALYALGFTWNGHSWSHHAFLTARWQPLIVLAAVTFASFGWAWKQNRSDLQPLSWCLLIALLPASCHLAGLDVGDSGWLWGAVACVALFVLNLGMIRVGITSGREGWINLGMAFIALNIVTRYFVLFGTLLEGGVFFIVTGLLILGLGYYLERKRRALVHSARAEVGS